jgi:hypothetical protein
VIQNGSVIVPATSDPAGGPTVTVQPGQTQTFTATWSPGANDGSTPAPSGTYFVIFRDNFQGTDESYFVIKSPLNDSIPFAEGVYSAAGQQIRID